MYKDRPPDLVPRPNTCISVYIQCKSLFQSGEEAALRKAERSKKAALQSLREREERQRHHKHLEKKYWRRMHETEMQRLDDLMKVTMLLSPLFAGT